MGDKTSMCMVWYVRMYKSSASAVFRVMTHFLVIAMEIVECERQSVTKLFSKEDKAPKMIG